MSIPQTRAPAPVVLIVEDEEPIAQALAYIVDEAGYTPEIALHGKDALAHLDQWRPDLIITDLMMPQMGGRELIRAVHDRWDSASPPIVLMTAANPQQIAASGADALLLKPFEIEDVEGLLRRFLGGTDINP